MPAYYAAPGPGLTRARPSSRHSRPVRCRAWHRDHRWLPQVRMAALPLRLHDGGCGLGTPPSDAEMIDYLQRERAAFDTIASMMIEDRIVGSLLVDPQPGESLDRRTRRERYVGLVERPGGAWADRARRGWASLGHPMLPGERRWRGRYRLQGLRLRDDSSLTDPAVARRRRPASVRGHVPARRWSVVPAGCTPDQLRM